MEHCNTDLNTLIALREAFERDVSDDVYAVREEIGEGPFNAKFGLRWDLTFRNVSATAERHGLMKFQCKRGFWGFTLYFNPTEKELFVLMKEPNPDRVAKKYRHYLNCLLLSNPSHNEALFPNEEYDALRKQEVFGMLGDFTMEVDRVYVLSKNVVKGATINTYLKFYSREGDLLEEEVIPNRVPSTTLGKISTKLPSLKGIKLKDKKSDLEHAMQNLE